MLAPATVAAEIAAGRAAAETWVTAGIRSRHDATTSWTNSMYGLGSGVWTNDVRKAHYLAKAIRAGSVWINCYQAMDPAVPFGGYKMSGNGREWGDYAFHEFLETKAVLGYAPKEAAE